MASFNNMNIYNDIAQDTDFTSIYGKLRKYCKNSCKNFGILKVAFSNDNIRMLYEESIKKHNESFIQNIYSDSGFDLFVPENVVFQNTTKPTFIDMKVKAEMVYCDVPSDEVYPSAYYLYPRSSLSKTELMMANHLGVIDSGYRGSLIGAFRWINPSSYNYTVEYKTRLVQICHPTLCPFYIVVVNENELTDTERGMGGFGSTGI
jgi:dUTP pyrophosphatase